MNKKQYQLIDWAKIEGIVYADCAHPFSVLGLRTENKEKMIQAFLPFAEKVYVVFDSNKKVEMEKIDEEGFFCLFPNKTLFSSYSFEVERKDGSSVKFGDPYAFRPVLDKKAFSEFAKGNNAESYSILGAKRTKVDTTEGYLYTVWAPNALRVSLVGEFNFWDGRVLPMEKDEELGVFYLFIPGLDIDKRYAFEILGKGGSTLVRNDPYSLDMESGVSVVGDLPAEKVKPLKKDKAPSLVDEAFNILEVDLMNYSKETVRLKEFGDSLIANAKKLNYSHIQLLPIQDRVADSRNYYHVLGMFSMDNKVGHKNDLIQFVKNCHEAGLGVILDLNLAYFSNVPNGMDNFDGTHLYEHADERQGYRSADNAFLYQYGNPFVKSYLKSIINYWLTFFGFDGIHFSNIAGMLYLDYKKNDGEWLPNIYGGKENLEAIDFIKELNAFIKKNHPSVLKIAEVDCVFDKVTNLNSKDSLGFDYMWNIGFADSMEDYLRLDPSYRSGAYDKLTNHVGYAFSERFILPLSHRECNENAMWLLENLPGTISDHFDNARAAIAYGMFYPGKKLTFANVSSQKSEEMDCFIASINEFYASQSVLCATDTVKDSIEWINTYSSDINTVVFIRKNKGKNGEFIVVVSNFSNSVLNEFTMGVPAPGKYKEIFNTDSSEFGGKGNNIKSFIVTEEREYDGFDQAITIKVPAMSTLVLSYKPFTESELKQIAIKKRKALEKYVSEEIKKLEENRQITITKIKSDEANAIEEYKKTAERLIEEAKKEAKERLNDTNKEADQKIKELQKLLK